MHLRKLLSECVHECNAKWPNINIRRYKCATTGIADKFDEVTEHLNENYDQIILKLRRMLLGIFACGAKTK